MTRQLAPLMLCLLATLAGAETPTTKPADHAYTTHEVISNPDIEALVKSLPKAALPKENETDAEMKARQKIIGAWQKTNMKNTVVNLKAVVISETVAAFRIEGMDKTVVMLAGRFPMGTYKLGDHVAIAATLQALVVRMWDDEMAFTFVLKDEKVSKFPQ